MKLELNVRYGVLTLAWIAFIYWLSSLPDIGVLEENRVVQVLANLAHVPLFAVLAYFCLRTFSRYRPSWKTCLIVVAVGAAYAGLDEWHQSFVPGRDASVGDALLDVVGVAGLLLIVRGQ